MRDTDHPNDGTLLELLVGELAEDAEALKATQTHVAGCAFCKARLERMRKRKIRPDPAQVRKAAAFDDMVREERAAASTLLEDVLSGPETWWRTGVFSNPETLTYGLAVGLVDRAVSMLSTSPGEAVELASIAVDVAERLRVDAYPFDLVITARANAWREYAYALFYIGRLNDAANAVGESERLFRQTPVPEIELARTSLIRAALLSARDQFRLRFLPQNPSGAFSPSPL